jgi:hypothetical protein
VELGGSRCGTTVFPELDITLGAQGAPSDETALLSHQILDCYRFVREDLLGSDMRTDPMPFFAHLEMIADQVPVLAIRARNQDRSLVVALLGKAV